MRKLNLVPLLFGVGTLLALALGYDEYVGSAGFPDGHLSEYHRKIKDLYSSFMIPGIIQGFHFLTITWTRGKYKTRFLLSIAVLVVYIIIAIIGADHYYYLLDHGQGG